MKLINLQQALHEIGLKHTHAYLEHDLDCDVEMFRFHGKGVYLWMARESGTQCAPLKHLPFIESMEHAIFTYQLSRAKCLMEVSVLEIREGVPYGTLKTRPINEFTRWLNQEKRHAATLTVEIQTADDCYTKTCNYTERWRNDLLRQLDLSVDQVQYIKCLKYE